MIQEPILSNVYSEKFLDIGTKVNFKELLGLPPEHKFLFNATGYSPQVLLQSLFRQMISVGGDEFLNNFFHRNVFLAMRMTTVASKLTLAKAIEKFLEYEDILNLKLLFFYFYFYLKTGGIDLETLKIIKPNFVIDFTKWRYSLREEEVMQLQNPGELWEGISLIGKNIKAPDREKLSRARNRALSLFSNEVQDIQSEDSI